MSPRADEPITALFDLRLTTSTISGALERLLIKLANIRHPVHRRVVTRAALWALGRSDDEIRMA